MEPKSENSARRVPPLSEWYGIMEKLQKEGKLELIKEEEEELALWDTTMADGLEDADWNFTLPAETEK